MQKLRGSASRRRPPQAVLRAGSRLSAKLLPAPLSFADERPDNAYPYALITGRELEHWHTGAMTRHASVLDALEPQPTVSIHPTLLAKLGLRAGESLQVQSRRGVIVLATRADPAVPEDAVFIPFAYAEAAANLFDTPPLLDTNTQDEKCPG